MSSQKFLDLRGAWAREYITGMRNYTGVKVMAIIEKFKEVDAKIKGLIIHPLVGELMKELIFLSFTDAEERGGEASSC